MPGLGFGLLTFADVSLAEMVELARLGEELGFQRVYTTESLTDTLAIDLALALGTTSIEVGSFVALTPYRHPVIAAQAALTISELSGGRFRLGLGPGHSARNRALGAAVDHGEVELAQYVAAVRAVLTGHGQRFYAELPPQTYQGVRLDFRSSPRRIPIGLAAVGPRMAGVAGSLADAVLMYLVAKGSLTDMRQRMRAGAERAERDPAAVEMVLGIHVFCSEDEAAARDRAREALSYWVGLDSYNRSLARAGFKGEAAEIRDAFGRGDRSALATAISDDVIDEFCLVGSVESCRAGIAALGEAGADFVALLPDPVTGDETYADAVRRTLRLLAQPPARSPSDPAGGVALMNSIPRTHRADQPGHTPPAQEVDYYQ